MIFFAKASSYSQCEKNVHDVIMTFIRQSFTIHPIKTQLVPKQGIVSLVNSRTMTISLPAKKKAHLKNITLKFLRIKKPTIRFLAEVIGTLVSPFPASRFGPLYYRVLEKDKVMALKKNSGDYSSGLSLPPVAKMELQWWLDNTDEMLNWIHPPIIVTEIFCDESNLGWGTVFDDRTTGGVWNYYEIDLHINVKEMLAVYYPLRSYAIDL